MTAELTSHQSQVLCILLDEIQCQCHFIDHVFEPMTKLKYGFGEVTGQTRNRGGEEFGKQQ